MSESVVNSESNRVGCMAEGSQSTMPTIANRALTNATLLEESVLSNNQTIEK